MKMFKKILVFFILFSFPFSAFADFSDETENVLKDITAQTEGFDFYGFAMDIAKDGELPSGKTLLSHISEFFGDELRKAFKSLVVIIVPVFLFGILKFIRTDENSASKHTA